MIGFAFLWLFVFAVPWENVVVIPGIGTISRLFGILAAGGALLSIVMNGRVRPLRSFHVALLLFLMWTSVGIYWAPSVDYASRKVVTYIQIVLVLWIMWELAPNPSRILNLCFAYVLGSYVAALNTIARYQEGIGTKRAALRFAAEGFDPNDLGMTLVLALPLAWYLSITHKSTVVRWAARAFIPVGGVAILLTGSRGAFLAAAVALMIIPLTLGRTGMAMRISAAVALVVSIYAAAVLVPATTWSRLGTMQSEIEGGTLNDRKLIWQAGLQAFPEHPILGWGPAGFHWAVTPILGYPIAAHNTFLSVLVEYGLIGFPIFIAIFLSIAAATLKLPVLERRFVLVELAAVVAAFMPLSWDDRKAGWIALGLCFTAAAALRAAPQELSVEPELQPVEISRPLRPRAVRRLPAGAR